MFLHEMFYPECKPITDLSVFEKFMFTSVVKEEKSQIKEEKSQIKEEKSQIKEEKSQIKEEKPQIKEEKLQIKEEKLQIKEEKLQIKEEKPQIKEEPKTIYTRLEKECIYTKGVQDGLFWSMYISQYGYDEYNRNKYNYGKIEVQEKEKIAEYLHKNGSQKETNYRLTRGFCCEIESDLITTPKMTFSGLIGMCAFYKCNILIVDLNKHIYYSFCSTSENTKETYILYKNPFYTGKMNSNEYFIDIDHKIYSVSELNDQFFKIDNFQKPMKSITNYKKIELEAIASKVVKEEKTTDKSLDKNQLYEKILLFISNI